MKSDFFPLHVKEIFNQISDRRSSSNHKIAWVQLTSKYSITVKLDSIFSPDFHLFISCLLKLFIINHDWT